MSAYFGRYSVDDKILQMKIRNSREKRLGITPDYRVRLGLVTFICFAAAVVLSTALFCAKCQLDRVESAGGMNTEIIGELK